MKQGEYIGKDGRTYRLVHGHCDSDWYVETLYEVGQWESSTLRVCDIDAAKAARDALIEEERDAEWVELPVPYFEDRRMRIRGDGSLVQHRRWNHDWQPLYPPDGDDHASVLAYRKGREVKEAEDAELREQVKALAEALFEVERGEEPPSHEWDDVLDMARAVLSLVTANSPDSDTLNAYAEIVQKVAEAEPWEYGYSDEPSCFYCEAYNQHRDEATSKIVHAPNCLWLRARKLRGME